jgi:hypothetical protein
MIRSFVAQATALLASAALAFLFIAPIAMTPATAGNLNFPSNCSVTDVGGGNFTLTCGSSNPSAFGCTLIGAPSGSVALNSVQSLFMSCSGGTQPYHYSWTPNLSTGSTLPVPTTVAGTTPYTVTATDSASGSSGPFTASVTVTGSSSDPGGGGATGLCAQYANVLPIVNATWGQPASWQSSQSGNFGDNAVWVFKLTVPQGTPTSIINGSFYVLEYQGPETLRQITISRSQCDFRTKDYTGANGPLAVANGTRATVYYGVGTPFLFGPAELTPSQTYYVNVRNWQLDPTPQSSCGQAACNVLMSAQPASP